MIVRCHKCHDRLSVEGVANSGANRAKQLGWKQRRVMVTFNGREHLAVVWFCSAGCDPKDRP